MPSLARRVHSTTDLTALRRADNRNDQRGLCEESLWDFEDRNLCEPIDVNDDTKEDNRKYAQPLTGLSQLAFNVMKMDPSEFVDNKLPQFDRSRNSESAMGTCHNANVKTDLNIDVDVVVPTFVADSMQTLSGVRIPLIPERAMNSLALRAEGMNEGPRNSSSLHNTSQHVYTRVLPPFVRHLSPMEKKLTERILSDDAWMMRTKAKANAKILQGNNGVGTKLSRGRSTSALAGMGGQQSSSLSDLFLEMLGRPVKHDTDTWYDKLNRRAGGDKGASNSQINLSVMAWDSVHVLPGQAVAPNAHCKVVTVKGDAGADTRQERSIEIVMRPTEIGETWSRFEYDRTPGQPPEFSISDLRDMRNEMISYKVTEMAVHPESRKNTHIYRSEITK
eukprot:CFRG0699T1